MQSSETDELEELYTLVNDVFEINIGEHPARSREEAKERLLKSGEVIQAYIDKYYVPKQRVVEAILPMEPILRDTSGGLLNHSMKQRLARNRLRAELRTRLGLEALGLAEKPE